MRSPRKTPISLKLIKGGVLIRSMGNGKKIENQLSGGGMSTRHQRGIRHMQSVPSQNVHQFETNEQATHTLAFQERTMLTRCGYTFHGIYLASRIL